MTRFNLALGEPGPTQVARRLGYKLRSFAGCTVGSFRLRRRSEKSFRGAHWLVEDAMRGILLHTRTTWEDLRCKSRP